MSNNDTVGGMAWPFRLVAVLALVFLPATWAEGENLREIHCEHFWMGMPLGAPRSNDLLIRDLYAVSTNDRTKFADWVAYRLTPREVYGDLDLMREWRTEPWLEADETLEATGPDDYSGAYAAAAYDRGHLAPLGSFRGSPEASSVNYYSNIVPQTRELNRGPWRKLEANVRELVRSHGEVFVVTGCLYDGDPMPLLPESNEAHQVPTGFFKVGAVPPSYIAAYVFPQRVSVQQRPEHFAVTVDEVERRSGLDLFWRLPDDVELDLEARSEGTP